MKIIENPKLDYECRNCQQYSTFDPPPIGAVALCPNCSDPLTLLDDGYSQDRERRHRQLDDFIENEDE